MTRMKIEQVIPGNPDTLYEFLAQNNRTPHMKSKLNGRKGSSCINRPETVHTDFEDLYEHHLENLKYRIKGLEIKAIQLLISQVVLGTYKFEISQEDENWWRDCINFGAIVSYSDESIERFYARFYVNSEYRKVLGKASNVFMIYNEKFPEYFI